MPSKLQLYMQMADEAQRQITGSYQGWTGFLSTAARLYKYPYAEQVMIHAQRPDATACAEYDFWNEKMGRYVRRGSRGIALIDSSGEKPRLRYVFDVADTGRTEQARTPYLWEYREEHAGAVSAMLESRYDVSGENGLPDQLEHIAAQLANEYWNDYQRDILDIVDDSFLNGYDDFNVGVAFRNAATVSITYSLMSRCGLEPENRFEHEDFLPIFDFNTPEAATELGTAVSRISGQVLRQIEVTIKNYEREKNAERSQNHDRTDLYEERRLSDPRPDAERDAGGSETPGQVRETSQELFAGAQTGSVQPSGAEREAVPTPAGDRRDSEQPTGADDVGAGEAERSDGGTESPRSDEVGRTDEQPESAGGGNDPERTGVQLTPDEPESEPAQPQAAYQLSLFPTEDEQIAFIEQGTSVFDAPVPFSMSIPQEEIDHVLRLAGNRDSGRMNIAAEFSKGKSTEEIAEYLKSTFRGGNGIITDHGRYSAWYAEDGIHIANGSSSRYLSSAHILPWNEAAERIGEMLDGGSFATNVELTEMPGHERQQLAQSLWYLYRDLSEEARSEKYLDLMETVQGGGFPDETARLAEQLINPEFRAQLTDQFAAFWTAREQDRSLMRFNYHHFDQIYAAMKDLSLERREFTTDMAELPEIGGFITEDEIAESLSGGSGMEGGKLRIYEYFSANHTPKELADFLKEEYGTGGHSHAVSGATHSSEDHSSKGLSLKKGNCAEIQLKWGDVAKRITDLIRKDRYLTPLEQEKYKAIHDAPTAYNSVKEQHPDDMILYQVGDFFEMYGEDAKIAAEELDLYLSFRRIPDVGRVDMCGIPARRLEEYVEKLRDKHDVTISAVNEDVHERHVYTMLSVDHEAERATDAYEAEFGADGYRAFPGNRPEEEPKRELTQDGIDESLLRWNGDPDSQNRMFSYMREHGRERGAAAWLSQEYGGDVNEPLHFSLAGSDTEVTLKWAQVQRRLLQLMNDGRFPEQQQNIAEYLGERGNTLYFYAPVSYGIETDFGDVPKLRDDQRVVIASPVCYHGDEFLQEHRVSFLKIGRDIEEAQLKGQPPTEQIAAMEQAENAFYTPEDRTYHVGDHVSIGNEADGKSEIVIENVDADYVYYTIPDLPEQEPVEILRSQFDAHLDDGLFAVIQPEEPAADLSPEQEQGFDEILDEAPISTVIDGEVKTFPNAEAMLDYEEQRDSFPYSVGDTVYLEDGKPFLIENIGMFDIQLRDPSLSYPILRAESRESFARLMKRFPQEQRAPEAPTPGYTIETVAEYPAEENHLPYDVVIQTIKTTEPDPPAQNFKITDDHLGEGGPKAKFRMNMDAINLLKELEFDGRQATPEEQEVLSKYVGWGGLADAFDETKQNWSEEFQELYATLSPEEYAAARASTLNAHFTSPTVISAIYDAVGRMGFTSGNILEPSMGVGNFFGMLPSEMSDSKLYGVELDSITGRIAKQLYPNANITVAGFETTDRKDFFDLAIGNVPFGQYQVSDPQYNKLGFSIHNYFFAKALDQVRPGGVVAFVTSRYTMDSKDNAARKYIAQRADFLGAIRLPNNAFKANAGTDVVSDIIFLQKRDRPIDIEPEWVHLGENTDGFAINSYFVDHPEMILGRQTSESTQYGRPDFTVEPIEGLELKDQLEDAVKYIRGTYTEAELPDLGEDEALVDSIPADPDVKNFSYTIVDGEVYYRQNSIMTKPDLNATAKERAKGMVALRNCVQKLIGQQMDGFIFDETIRETQAELNTLYDSFTAKYGLINSRANALAFADDSSYYLLCSLEELDEDKNLKRKADMFTKRTIKAHEVVTSVDTASEALALSISERACVDMGYMSSLTGKDEDTLASELRGVIFQNPENKQWETADEYLSGNVREKLRIAQSAQNLYEGNYADNVEALKAAQPKDLDASEIEIRLGATWIDPEYIREFMWETFETPFYQRRMIDVNYSSFTAEWNIKNKSAVSYNNIAAYMTYGTERANAYKILEDTLNLRDVRIYDTKYDADGKERRVLNSKETTLAQQKQQAIKDAFRDWIWKDPDRRHDLVTKYNELFNSTRPREYDGSHITFSGMNPEIRLREHQLNAVAHILYGGNTLLAHEVGAGKTFEMVAAAMESKRLGMCQKSLFVVPNHLTEQWSSEFLRLYPSANILVATKKDFEPKNRKKFCARIATGDYDAVIIGHSQFEKIPVSMERQQRLLEEQIYEVEEGLRELKEQRAERFTIKSLERTKRGLETKLKKLQDSTRKDDVVTFEQLGVDRLYVDEAHNYKNLFLYTKMRNVAGLSATDAQKSSDMLLKCRYIDEITDSRGVVFATGTPVSNSMTELYTMMRYLQHDTIRGKGLAHFDCWASTFGETQTAIELAPEGTGYRARTRFAKFFNLPELMTLFKEAADIKTSDQLNLPTPTPIYHNEVAQPTEIQKEMVQELSERAAKVHAQLVDPSTDNMLKITSDGRKLGLDQRVINPDLPDDPNSKVNMCVNNIARIYEEGNADKLTQLVFCDLSTPKTAPVQRAAKTAGGNLDSPEINALERLIDSENPDEPGFTVYDDIREKLVAKGIPREEIAFIHEANTETRKKELFAKVRNGQVRVLMGSTFKMGAGMNVQDRLVALHDLDCPWRPGDLEQRSGRIIRQGNQNKEVHIYRYVTESTFDAYLWQTVENKQKFISQIMTSKSPVRSCDDVDETALSYAEIKALCAGDERIKKKMDLDVDVARLKLMKANHQSQQFRLEDNLLKTFPEQIRQNEGFVEGFTADLKTLSEHPHPEDGFAGMEVKGDFLTDKDNAGAAILEAFKDAKGMEPVPIGSYRGFSMSLTVEDFGRDFVLTLKGKMNHRVTLGKDARGNLVRIDNALNAIPERMQAVQDKLGTLREQVETAKAELGKPFPQEEELRIKSARLAELNAELNIDDKTPMEQMAEDAPAVETAKAKPSVLVKLKAPLPPRTDGKSRQHEQEER